MNLASNIERARSMRRKGHTLHRIGRELGVEPERIRSWMYPRQWWPAQASPSKPKLTEAQREQAQAQAFRKRQIRSLKIQRLWGKGLTAQQIAGQIEDLGVGGVQTEIVRLREAGWDLPSRQKRAAA